MDSQPNVVTVDSLPTSVMDADINGHTPMDPFMWLLDSSITANKHQGIRAAICWNEELAILARSHNNANIVCIPSRFITLDEAKQIVNTFLSTAFEGGRHANRVDKMAC